MGENVMDSLLSSLTKRYFQLLKSDSVQSLYSVILEDSISSFPLLPFT